jgi:hypothetical protein
MIKMISMIFNHENHQNHINHSSDSEIFNHKKKSSCRRALISSITPLLKIGHASTATSWSLQLLFYINIFKNKINLKAQKFPFSEGVAVRRTDGVVNKTD